MVRRDLSTPQERFPLKTGKCVPLSDVVVILSRLGRARKTIGEWENDNRKVGRGGPDIDGGCPKGPPRPYATPSEEVSPSSGAKELPSDVGSRTPIASFGSNHAGIKSVAANPRVIPKSAATSATHREAVPKPEQGTSYGRRLGTLIRVLSIHEPQGDRLNHGVVPQTETKEARRSRRTGLIGGSP